MFGKKFRSLLLVSLLLAAGSVALAQRSPNRDSQADVSSQARLVKKVRKELVTIPYYGVFDNLAFQIDGGTVTLSGQVVRPTTKSDAEGRVSKIEGVTRVVNNIEVLPLSPHDDDIRLAMFRALFSHPSLQKYSLGADPSIHIIVKNGNVTLEGVVINQGDRNIANIRARQVPGVFSVTNNLRVERRRS